MKYKTYIKGYLNPWKVKTSEHHTNPALPQCNHTSLNMSIVLKLRNSAYFKYLFSDLNTYHKPDNDMKTLLNCSSTAISCQEMINPHHQAQ
mgnify:CR=1 FL=1